MLTSVATGKLPKKLEPQVEANQTGSSVFAVAREALCQSSCYCTLDSYRVDKDDWLCRSRLRSMQDLHGAAVDKPC